MGADREIWDHNAGCPMHEVGVVTVHIGRGGGVTLTGCARSLSLVRAAKGAAPRLDPSFVMSR